MRKLPIACEYDPQLTISEDRQEDIDRIWEEVHYRGESLLQTMVSVMPKLTTSESAGHHPCKNRL